MVTYERSTYYIQLIKVDLYKKNYCDAYSIQFAKQFISVPLPGRYPNATRTLPGRYPAATRPLPGRYPAAFLFFLFFFLLVQWRVRN